MSLGSGEIFIIVILALLLFGPDKLPELARQAARVIRDVRRAADEVKSQFNILGDDEDDEPRRPLASMRDKINDRDDAKSEDENAISSTQSNESDDPNAHKYGDAIDADDTYFINDENGASSADNDWRNCEEDRVKSQGTDIDYSNIDYSNIEYSSIGETDASMTAKEKTLFGTTPTAFEETTEAPRDRLSDLEMRVTPTTSVARSAPPNRVRVEENENQEL